MTTYRERREARVERLQGWSEAAEKKADAAHDRVHQIADGIPFGQPILVGHHSERHARRDQERMHSGMRTSIDESRKASRHAERASNIEHQLATSVYDDDEDAVERLETRIAEREAERDRRKETNAAYRKEHGAALKTMTPYERSQAVPYPSYSLTNLGATIRNDKQRLERIKRDAEREAAGIQETPRQMLARFSSTCDECGEPIEKGSMILYFKRARRAIHATHDEKEGTR